MRFSEPSESHCYIRHQNSLLFTGLFIVLPCIESYKKVDLRTITLGVPPQEVRDSEQSVCSLFDFSLCSFWPRTAWRCQWTPWSTTGCPTPSWAWQMWRTRITAQSMQIRQMLLNFSLTHAPTIFQTARTNIAQKHSWNKESSWDSQWQRQYCGCHAGCHLHTN